MRRSTGGADLAEDDESGGAGAHDGGAKLRVLCYGAMAGQVIYGLA